jgi:hypothetical protein
MMLVDHMIKPPNTSFRGGTTRNLLSPVLARDEKQISRFARNDDSGKAGLSFADKPEHGEAT